MSDASRSAVRAGETLRTGIQALRECERLQPCHDRSVPDPLRSILLFLAAALLEIGGAWLVWQGVREHRGVSWVGAGIMALAAYGLVATFQSDPNFGRILTTRRSLRGGLARVGRHRGWVRPDRFDFFDAAFCLLAWVGSWMRLGDKRMRLTFRWA